MGESAVYGVDQFRADGSAVSTPVWFVTDGTEIVLWTAARSAKVRRVRHDPRCLVAPCTMSGRVTGVALAGAARIRPAVDGVRIQRLLRAKYPIQRRALEAYRWLQRRGRPPAPGGDAYLAVRLDP